MFTLPGSWSAIIAVSGDILADVVLRALTFYDPPTD